MTHNSGHDSTIEKCGEGIESEWERLVTEIVQCYRCPRLVNWREQTAKQKSSAYKDWEYWGRPVPGFGDRDAQLFIVGLAPGAHGSNRTGRMFTGDSSGDTLYAALYRAGFASQPQAIHRNDGLVLRDAFLTAIVRCVPPANRPTKDEIEACGQFLAREWQLLHRVRVVLALGQLAFERCRQLLTAQGYDVPPLHFAHAQHCRLERTIAGTSIHLIASYHPSRQNTQTGRLTPSMLDAVLGMAHTLIDEEERREAGEKKFLPRVSSTDRRGDSHRPFHPGFRGAGVQDPLEFDGTHPTRGGLSAGE